MRDSVSTLPQKLCKEFTIDLEYFKKTFPEKNPSKMTVISMSLGFIALSGNESPENKLLLAKHLNDIVSTTISSCAKQPNSKFFDIFKQAAEEVKSKGDS